MLLAAAALPLSRVTEIKAWENRPTSPFVDDNHKKCLLPAGRRSRHSD
jgi:hypothetical protein